MSSDVANICSLPWSEKGLFESGQEEHLDKKGGKLWVEYATAKDAYDFEKKVIDKYFNIKGDGILMGKFPEWIW